ncbi:MAG: hypothetical protein BWK73_39125 [Thiothrix lacustris]|uniref:Uncharacterized protein n=1 Tax=Thiothrix lacustris TaxID=525917 RepID=A0A1Y1QE24_9GAMM|nr:MAG: hypothetical protein BWK73_39125 [Thiothrix lacustris]
MTEIIITKNEIKERAKVIRQKIKDGTLPDDEKKILKGIQAKIDDNAGKEFDYSKQVIIVLGFDSAKTIDDNREKIMEAFDRFKSELREIKGFRSTHVDAIKPDCKPLKGTYSYYLKLGEDSSKRASKASQNRTDKRKKDRARKLWSDWKNDGEKNKTRFVGHLAEKRGTSIDTMWDWFEEFEENYFSSQIRDM